MCCHLEKVSMSSMTNVSVLYNTEALNLKKCSNVWLLWGELTLYVGPIVTAKQIDPKAWVAARIKFWKM